MADAALWKELNLEGLCRFSHKKHAVEFQLRILLLWSQRRLRGSIASFYWSLLKMQGRKAWDLIPFWHSKAAAYKSDMVISQKVVLLTWKTRAHDRSVLNARKMSCVEPLQQSFNWAFCCLWHIQNFAEWFTQNWRFPFKITIFLLYDNGKNLSIHFLQNFASWCSGWKVVPVLSDPMTLL